MSVSVTGYPDKGVGKLTTADPFKGLLVFFVLLFLTAPGFSLIQALSGLFFPNEKLSFIFVFVLFFLGSFFISKNLIFVFSIAFFLFLLVIGSRHFYYNIDVVRADFNHLYLLFALPVYFGFASKFKDDIFSVLPYVVLVQLACSSIQQYLCLSGSCDTAGVFLNYYSQEFYVPPLSNFGFYRTYGLFNESSQYAAFLAFYIILVHMGLVESRFSVFLAVIAFLDLLVNNSITAYLLIFAYFLVNFRFSFLAVFSLFIVSCAVLLNLDKIITTVLMSADTHPRLIYSIDRIILTFDTFPFFGAGLSWDHPSWDVFSIYFSGFGLVIFLVIMVFLVSMFIYFPVSLVFPYFFYSLTNGLFLGSLNILVLIFFAAARTHYRTKIEFR